MCVLHSRLEHILAHRYLATLTPSSSVSVQWLDFRDGIRSFEALKKTLLLRSARALHKREPASIVYGSREELVKTWVRGPKFTVHAVPPSTITGERVVRLHKGLPETPIQCDEDVFALPHLTVIRVFGVWSYPEK